MQGARHWAQGENKTKGSGVHKGARLKVRQDQERRGSQGSGIRAKRKKGPGGPKVPAFMVKKKIYPALFF